MLKFLKKIFDCFNSDREIQLLKAEKLFWAIGYVIMSAIYMKDSIGTGQTYCNVASYDLFDSRCRSVWWNDIQVGESTIVKLPMGNVAQAYDYDLSPIMPGFTVESILNAPISAVYDNCLKYNGTDTKIVEPTTAQNLANHGIPVMVISKKFNHVAIVCPNLKWDTDEGKMKILPFDYEKGCFTGNPGKHNDYMYMNDTKGFGAVDWKNREILYVQFKLVGSSEFEIV